MSDGSGRKASSGRWSAEPNEPFNAGLGGFSPDLVRYHGPASNRRAIALLWCTGILLIGLGVVGPSIFLGALGGLLVTTLALRLLVRSRRGRGPTAGC